MTHTFALVLSFAAGEGLEVHLEALARAGCDDAAFVGPAVDGTYTAEFDREAPDFVTAVMRAITDVRQAGVGATVLRVMPDDLVTISAIAARTGRTDESVRLLQRGARGPGGFPPPLGRINEKTQVWRWADVARWFAEVLGEAPPAVEHARFLAAVNHALGLAAVSDQRPVSVEELAAIASLLPEAVRRSRAPTT